MPPFAVRKAACYFCVDYQIVTGKKKRLANKTLKRLRHLMVSSLMNLPKLS